MRDDWKVSTVRDLADKRRCNCDNSGRGKTVLSVRLDFVTEEDSLMLFRKPK